MGRIASAAVVALVALSPGAAAQAVAGNSSGGGSAAARVGAVPGGRYVAHLRPRKRVDIDLRFTLANDGREFAKPSSAAINEQCTRNAGASDGFDLSNFGEEFRSVQVRRKGRFSYRAYGYRLAGRFIDRGRSAVGTVSFPRLERGCPRITARFRARLKGRPNASPPGRRRGV